MMVHDVVLLNNSNYMFPAQFCLISFTNQCSNPNQRRSDPTVHMALAGKISPRIPAAQLTSHLAPPSDATKVSKSPVQYVPSNIQRHPELIQRNN